ncbi:molecular chaperone TorD family protein [Virgibacillus sp. NKC19-3]|uniref:TorD/DmsD family molecular chaperone n=1 Tax=Virgibacillus saliphilus TaxID=2831674 RepID=UPI001C9A5015|nr:molecular chaperone TorD family protein [Virgibacillus sp. NKC19-3]MBY7142063.1 molecular chaperone TorD family protein [Virgibacillus sp. NKC19-3]
MEKVIDQSYYSTIEERETMYTFLKVVFEAPLTIDTLTQWKENFTPAFIDILTIENEALYQSFEKLRNSDLESFEAEEKAAYLATFNVFNESGHIPAPPWESVYVTKDRTMFAEPVFQMRKQWESFGMEIVNKHRVPEDHISIELEFMCYLIDFTREALRLSNKENFVRGIYTQFWLLKDHLNHWVKPFTRDILSSDTSDFYKGVAKLLQLFVEEDVEYMKSIKEVLDHE